MKIAIFGAGGLTGKDLVLIGQKNAHQIIPYHRDVDICDATLVAKRLKADRPDWVINTAGQSNVDVSEKDSACAYAINQKGVKNLSDACTVIDVPLVHLSTDYVYSGDQHHIYLETDPVNPISEYGRSKAAGEIEVTQHRKHYTLRVSSLFGMARDTHVSRVIQAVQAGTMVKIATDMICSPTYTINLAEMIFLLIEKQPAYGIYHALTRDFCSRYEFAEEICRLMGANPSAHLEKIKINAVGLPAKRPETLRLSSEKWQKSIGPIASWKEGLHRFFSDAKILN